MSQDWLDQVAGALPHLLGTGALGVSALAYFRAGRFVGKAESRLDVHDDKIKSLETRADVADAADVELGLKLAEKPNRDEVRAMFAEQRGDTRAAIGELREDLRALARG